MESNENSESIIKLDNGLNASLNENDLTAKIIKSKDVQGDVIVPKYIKYKSKIYTIVRIDSFAFEYNRLIDSLSFAENSEVRSIGKNAFYQCSIKSLTIPSHFEEFENEWCLNALNLSCVDSPDNQHFTKANHSFLLFREDLKNQNFDVLIFAPHDISGKVEIPSYVKRITPYAFNLCYKMTSVHLPQNTSLQEIEMYAFYKCYFLKNITPLPKTVTKIGRWCFAYSNHLTSIEFLGNEVMLDVGCFSRCSSLFCVSFPNGIKIDVCQHAFGRLTEEFSLFCKHGAKIVQSSPIS